MLLLALTLTLLSCQRPPEPTPPEGDLAVLLALEADPSQASRLCPQLQGTDARARCEALSLRPHLWSTPPSRKQARRQADGPSSRQLAPRATSRLDGISASGAACTDGPTEATCYEARALSAATAAEAVAECNNLPARADGGWRAECPFASAAQAAVYADAMELCLLTGPYQSNCFQHLSMSRAEAIPAATDERDASWVAIRENAAEIRTDWAGRDPAFGAAMVDMMWARALDTSYVRAGIVAGNPLDHLPADAHPHVRAAAAYHLMSAEGATAFGSLAAWTARTERALAARLTRTDRRQQRPFHRARSPHAWDTDRPGDDDIPARYYMTDGRRTADPDTSVDVAICVLEAAARLQNGAALLEEGTQHPSPRVQWTAQRLLGR